MKTYQFTELELRNLLWGALREFAQFEGVYDFSENGKKKVVDNAIDRLSGNVLDNSETIPFKGEPVPYNDEDNISPEAVGADLWF